MAARFKTRGKTFDFVAVFADGKVMRGSAYGSSKAKAKTEAREHIRSKTKKKPVCIQIF